MFWFGFIFGIMAGICFCIAWVFVGIGLDLIKATNRKFLWRQLKFVHADKYQLEQIHKGEK